MAPLPGLLQLLHNEEAMDSDPPIVPDPKTPQTNMKTTVPPDEYYTPGILNHLELHKVPVGLGTVFTHLIRKTGLSDRKIPTDEEETVMAQAISLIAQIKHHGDPYYTCRNDILTIILGLSDDILREWSMGQAIIDEKSRRSDKTSEKANPLGSQPPQIIEAVTTICNIMAACKFNEDMIIQ